ncbi:L-lactate dehydrogenase [Lysobacter sp. CA199]|uniref:L-lactate dehydrogenase n=1 Tax=Lysobacter sp. CA199 TaxID=3455608 RepID=UPI003F8D7512
MGRPICDLREAAKARLPRLLFDYIDGGSYDEVTLQRNRDALRSIALRQRVMTDISSLRMDTTLFGQSLALPLALAPVGFAGMYARRGEVQAARAAKAAGVPFCLSTLSICGLEEVVRDSGAPVWFQLYMVRDRGFCQALLQRARAAASPVLLLTVDLPIAGARYRDLRSGMSGPAGWRGAAMRAWQGATHPAWLWNVQLNGRPHGFGNIPPEVIGEGGVGGFADWIKSNLDPTVTWKDIAWLRERWDGPIVIKGLLDRADAREALACGVDGIVVSNHGGRQLDGVPASASALPAIVEEVAGRVPVLADGGIRSGLDVLRMLALGADACLVGRAWAYALGAAGEAGVAEMLATLRSELEVAMSLTGCTDVREAGRHLLVD